MPLIEEEEGQEPDLHQLSFRNRLTGGRVVPIISDQTILDLVLGKYVDIVKGYARHTKNPTVAPIDLVRLVKAHKYKQRVKPLADQEIKFDYLNYVKNHFYRQARETVSDPDMLAAAAAEIDSLSVSAFAHRLGYPTFVGERDDPLLILASKPFKTLLTTSPFTFIEDALIRAGKRPRTEVCRWSKDLRDSIPSTIDDAYQPSELEPLVYHLLGLDLYVDSLVLTEDDFLDYLGNICQGQGNQAADFIPALVRKAFSDDLIVLGFSLDDWAFRVVYAGLIKRSGKAEDRGVCTIQLPDTPDERGLLEDYMVREAKFRVFWGTMVEYTQNELRQEQGVMTTNPEPGQATSSAIGAERNATPSTNPYVGPRTFREAEGNLFFGREREARDLTARIVSERLLLFYAQSGAGKSSLLNTRVIPRLRDEEGFHVLPVGRVSGEIPSGVADVSNIFIFNLIIGLDQSKEHPARLAQLTLRQFLTQLAGESVIGADGQRTRRWVYKPEARVTATPPDAPPTKAGPRFVLIIDQFEEIITSHPTRWREREAFFQQLDEAMRADPNLWVLLTLREDFVAALDPYAQAMADRLRARFYMEQMKIDAALAAIKQPAVLAGRPFAANVAEALVDNLRRVKVYGQAEEQLDQYVEPVQLQVVCNQLWARLAERPTSPSLAASSSTITTADLEALAGERGLATLVNQALGDYYETALQTVLRTPDHAISERALRDWFSNRLITNTETRGIVNLDPDEHTVAGLPQAIVTNLASHSLVRAESRAGGIWYELVHDRLIQPILAANRTWLLNQSNPVTSAARLWDDNQQREQFLLRGELLDQAQQFAANNAQMLGDLERAYLDACEQLRTIERARRNQYLAATMAIATVVALLFVLYTLRQGAIANATLVANYSNLQADKEIDTALLLAVQAVKMYNSPETRSQLHYATARSYEPEVALLTAHEDEVWGTAYSPDGQLIATASQDGSILLWDANTYQVVRRLQAPEANLSYYRIAYSPDGRLLAAGGFGGYLLIWDLQSGNIAQTLKEHRDSIFNLAFSADGSHLATVSSDKKIILWDVATWQARVVGEHTDWVWDVAFSPDGALLATASRDKTVRLWDLTQPITLTYTLSLTDHEIAVTSVAFYPSMTTTLLVSGDVNGRMIVWNLDAWRKTRQRPLQSERLKKQDGYIWSLAFSPNGAILASTSSQFFLRYWQFDPTQPLAQMNPQPLSLVLRGHTDDVVDVAFRPDGQQVVVASVDGTASVWNVNNGNLLSAAAGLVKSIVLIDDEKTLLTASEDGVVRAWDSSTFQTLRWEWLVNAGVSISHTLLSADGTKVLVATAKRRLQLWDVETQKVILEVQPLSFAPITVLAISPDQRQIAAGQSDGRISLWQIDQPTPLQGGLLGQQGRVDALAFSPDNQWLASGGCNLANVEVSAAIGCPGEILLWSTQSRSQIGDPLAKVGENSAVGYSQLGHINTLAFSHDNRRLASGSSRGLVTLWDVETHKVLDENKEHKRTLVRSLIFTPDDRLLISAGPWGTVDDSTGSIILWDVERGVRFGRSLNEHYDRVNALLLSKNGLTLYSAGYDEYIVVHNLDINYWFRRACQLANRNLTLREWQRYIRSGRSYQATCQ